jgi:hypothetical protein
MSRAVLDGPSLIFTCAIVASRPWVYERLSAVALPTKGLLPENRLKNAGRAIGSHFRQHLLSVLVTWVQVVIKLAEHDISVNALSALRFGIAALCFAPAAARGLRNKEMRLSALELGLWLFGGRLIPDAADPKLPHAALWFWSWSGHAVDACHSSQCDQTHQRAAFQPVCLSLLVDVPEWQVGSCQGGNLQLAHA